MPDFWVGMLLLTLLAVVLGWFPVGGLVDPSSDATGLAKLADQARHMVLPAATLTIAYLGEYALVMRSSLVDTMREDYLTLARAKGLRDAYVRNRHAVPNALLPVVTLLAINFGFVRQPAKTGPVVYSMSSPTYPRLAPVAAASGAGNGGGGSGTVIAIVVAAVILVAGGAFWLQRRRTAYERE
jgi:ABC-type antimicrobial peptide transport system permease subunit